MGNPDEGLESIEMNKTEVVMDKPVYVGMRVDASKTKLYEFHYDYLYVA